MESQHNYTPKINFEFSRTDSGFFIFEWIELVSYFRKITEIVDNYIIKCSIKNYYSNNGLNDARSLLRKIIENLNIYIYDMLHVEYFITFA